MTHQARSFRPRLTWPVRLVALLSCLSASLSATPVAFDIPAQPAPAALQLFIRQSGAKVLFVYDDLKVVQTNAVKGVIEPVEAIDQLLAQTGFIVKGDGGGKFVIARQGAGKPGSIEGYVRAADSGRGVAGARVEIAGTDKFVLTDKRGRFTFDEAPTGDQELHITAEGMQNTKVTDVTVKAGHRHTISAINIPAHPAGVVKLDTYVVSAKKNDGVIELDPYSVEGRREKPFTTANMDIPRTINDAQPYVILDAKTIDQSGATNVEDFLKQRLTMNTTVITNGQQSIGNEYGNTSSINLRGLGADKTLILVNGRRMASVTRDGNYSQPDLNGIPLSAIDRIEVLPSSASGIYGGSAVGGVVNVILKKDYAGGEIRASYDNTWNADSPRRTLSATYGLALEGGKTHVLLSASWSDEKPLLLQDRRKIFDRNLARVLINSPTYFTVDGNNQSVVFLGATPNIESAIAYYPVPAGTPGSIGPFPVGTFFPGFTSAPATAANRSFLLGRPPLVLKNGRGELNSPITHVAVGTSPTTSADNLAASLLTNAGTYNLDLPATTQPPTGLSRSFGVTPEMKSLQVSVRRQMTSNLELFADFSYGDNSSELIVPAVFNRIGLPTASPINPFTWDVYIMVPDTTSASLTTQSVSRNFTVGAIAQLPWGWTGELDYTRSNSRLRVKNQVMDQEALSADLLSGVVNPFVDTQLYPIDFDKYLFLYDFTGISFLDDYALRGSGPLFKLPWGTPSLTLGLEHRIAKTPAYTSMENHPLMPARNNVRTFFARQQVTDSLYGETTIPLMKSDWLPMVHSFELQLSGRSERYTVDTGTSVHVVYLNDPSRSYYDGRTSNGQPIFSRASYTSTNGTAGLKYQPVPELTLRASLATAFLPPVPDQLIKFPTVDSYQPLVTDPKTGTSYSVSTIGGGNPDLKPQHSKSLNVGVIWEPNWAALKGLRVNAEYYRIEQFDAISSLPTQQLINLEDTFPGRVTRGASGTITLVDQSLLNLFKRETEGWDLSADYTLKTGVGTFNIQAVGSIILHLKNQFAKTLPEYDSVNFPAENGAAKYKSNATLTWESRGWTAGWSVRYFGAYKQFGAAGGPEAVQRSASGNNTLYTRYTGPQGGDTIPSQMYHDLFVGYAFGKTSREVKTWSAAGSNVLNGMTVQVGVRNVFDKEPPFDVYYGVRYMFLSPYGDARLRSYSISVKKAF